MDLIAAEGNNPKFTDHTLKVTPTESPLSPFAYVAPANLVLFMGIAVLVALGRDGRDAAASASHNACLPRPSRKRAVVFGQMASMMVTAIAMALGLLFVGIILFNVHWGNPLSVLLVVVLLGICIAALLRHHRDVVARSQEQAIATAVIVAIVAGMLGRLRLPARYGQHDRPRGRAHCAAGLGHGYVRQADLRPRQFHRARCPPIGALAAFAVGLSVLAVVYYSRKVFSTAT